MEPGAGSHAVSEWASIQEQIATVRLQRNGREYWVHLGSVNGGDYYGIASMSPEPMVQEVEGNELLEQFASQGFVALDVHFDTGKATLRPESAEGLDRAAAMLQQAPAVRAEVGGHTDNVGKPESNRLLSQQRAESVRAALVQRGVAADRLTAKGYGDTVPVADNRSEAGRAANRRVEVRKTGGELGRATAASTTSTPTAKRAEPEADGGEPGFVQQRASNARDTVESEAGAKVDDTVREKARGLLDRLF
jgi:outer membrane protein OmpA-like peptidoglycan-associated protein